jgi:erythromycin esterase-like protein
VSGCDKWRQASDWRAMMAYLAERARQRVMAAEDDWPDAMRVSFDLTDSSFSETQKDPAPSQY